MSALGIAEQLAIELGAPKGDRDGTKLVPMLCARDESAERVLSNEGFIFELKLDGVRIVADKRDDRVSLGYRKVRSATSSYPEIAEALAKLTERRVVLDGEVVAFDEQGRPDFQRLGTRIQSRGRSAKRAAFDVPVAYVVFDVLVVGERDVTGLPIEARKRILEEILGETSKAGSHIRLHPTFPDGKELFRLCREHQLEGVVAKRVGSTYRPDDRGDWVKVKCELDADLVVVGWTEGEGKRSRLGALDLAAYDGDRLILRGRVGSGLDEGTIEALLERLLVLEVPKPVAQGKYSAKHGQHHVSPEIVVSVRYTGMTGDGVMRHPVFRGLRLDLAPRDCTVTEAGPRGGRTSPTPTPRARTTARSTVVLSDGTTKDALCKYYEGVAPRMLPHLGGRICPPLRAATRLWPLPAWTPGWVRTGVVARSTDEVRGLLIEDVDTLLFLVEAGGASVRMTPVREAAPRVTDFVALSVQGAGAVAVAHRARELVLATGLTPFVKANGTSLEVLIPIGNAPAEAAELVAALFVRHVSRTARAEHAEVERIEAPFAPYAVVVPVVAGCAATASLPVDWDDLAAVMRAPPPLDAVLDGLSSGATDPLRAMLDVRVDFTRAVRAIEQIVAEGGFDGA